MVAVHERSYCCSLQGGAMMRCRRLGRENGGGGSDSRQMADARTGSSETTLVDSCLLTDSFYCTRNWCSKLLQIQYYF